MTTTPQFLTRDGYEKLQAELDYLRTVKRKEIARRLHEALDGEEIIENAEYEAAKNEQAFLEGRIQELELLLAAARIIEDQPRMTDKVDIGAWVTIQEADLPPERYRIVGAVEANPAQGLISNESPLGRALLGHRQGDEVTVRVPGGETYTVRIVQVE